VNAAVERRAGVEDALKQIHGGLAALAPGIATGWNNRPRGSSPAKRGRGTAEGGGGGE
jgi:hypothetical protein